MAGQGRAIECDNCKATGSLSGVYIQWSDGTKKLKKDVRAYFQISKIRGDRDVEPFDTLHFCTVECLVEHAPKLTVEDEPACEHPNAYQDMIQWLWHCEDCGAHSMKTRP